MRRITCREIEDYSGCPPIIRRFAMEYLGFVMRTTGIYDCAVPILEKVVDKSNASRFLDLCSGAGGPWPRLAKLLRERGVENNIVLSDKFPQTAVRPMDHIGYHPVPVELPHVPVQLQGIRTLFTAFHHLSEQDAREFLENSVSGRQSIAVFEVTERSVAALLAMLLTPLLVCAATPFIEPRDWRRFALTYLFPLLPVMITADGVISVLKSYKVSELEAIVRQVRGNEGYEWEIGRRRTRLPGYRITYLIGTPLLSD